MGRGLIPAMRNVATEGGCPIAHSQHLADWRGRSIHFVNARGEQESQAADANPLLWSGRLWAGWGVLTERRILYVKGSGYRGAFGLHATDGAANSLSVKKLNPVDHALTLIPRPTSLTRKP